MNIVNTVISAGSPVIGLIIQDTSTGKYFNKSVGFIIEHLQDNRYLAITCKHVVKDISGIQKLQVIHKENKIRHTVAMPIQDPLVDSDVAFVVVDWKGDAPWILSLEQDPPIIEQPQNMISLQHQWNGFLGSELHVFNNAGVTEYTDVITYRSLKEAITEFVRKEDEIQILEIKMKGYIPHRVFRMMSRNGFSGSPILDEQGNLYGMNASGTEPGTESHQKRGNIAICLPVSELKKARQRCHELIRAVCPI